MLPRDPRSYLLDILQAIALAHAAVRDRTLRQYESDALLRSAVERQFITVGEALVQLLRIAPEFESRISHTRQIIAFRNILVHRYAQIAHDIVWSALEEDLPLLRRETETLLDELGGGD